LFQLYNYYVSPEKDFARKLKPVLGFTPARLYLFKMAFSHKSMSQERSESNYNNERLEYLGDAVLSTLVAEYLFTKYPNKDEGFLTQMRSRIVKRKTLNEIADNMGIDVILSDYSNGKLSSSMKGNALEALVGALYIEFGYEKTRNYVINRILRRYLNIHDLENNDDNHKSQLLEWSQKYNKEVEFRMLGKIKHDKRDYYKMALFIEGKEMARAEDFNKKSAEQIAAGIVMGKLNLPVEHGIVDEVDE
jgi:ribonuclease III